MKKALLLEDSLDDIATYRRKFLLFEGWELHAFHNTVDAVKACRNESFDLYLVDSYLTQFHKQPKPFEYADGSDFIIQLRKNNAKIFGVIIIITQHTTPSEVGGRWRRDGSNSKDYIVSKSSVADDHDFKVVVSEILSDYAKL